MVTLDFSSPFPLQSSQCTLRVEVSEDLQSWSSLPSNSYQETGRDHSPDEGTTRISIHLIENTAGNEQRYYRASWVPRDS